MSSEKPIAIAVKNSITDLPSAHVSMPVPMLTATEKQAFLYMEAAKFYLTHSMATARDLMHAQNMNDFLARASAAAKEHIEQTISYGGRMRANCVEVTDGFNKLIKTALPSQPRDPA
jgi:hypothetical protein